MKNSKRQSLYSDGNYPDIKKCYNPDDIKDIQYERDSGDPGNYPFLRGPYHEGYTKRSWRTLQYAGFGSGGDTNARWKFLLSQGQRGLNLAFDLPTQLGYDSDNLRARGEVGKTGVAIDSLADMETLYDGIDIGKVSSSFTINATANIILAMYMALAEKQSIPLDKLSGTLQNDILKEFTARGLYIYPPKESVKMTVDIVEYCIRHAPGMNSVNIGCHMMGAGATQIQTWAIMLLTAMFYTREALKRGLTVDQILPKITFLTNVDMKFFTSIACHRAARRMWAKICKETFKAESEKAMIMKMGTGLHALDLVDKQPLNNIARIAVMALAAALSGTQSMHLASYDESYAIPSEEATRISLMIQHILINETDICRTEDPLGGSYALETMTNDMESAIKEVMADIENQGGIVDLIEKGVIQKQIASQAYRDKKLIEKGERIVIGVNKYVIEEDRKKYERNMFSLDAEVELKQIERLKKVKSQRDAETVRDCLNKLKTAALNNENLLPSLIEACKNYCTIGELTNALKEIYGEYHGSNII